MIRIGSVSVLPNPLKLNFKIIHNFEAKTDQYKDTVKQTLPNESMKLIQRNCEKIFTNRIPSLNFYSGLNLPIKRSLEA